MTNDRYFDCVKSGSQPAPTAEAFVGKSGQTEVTGRSLSGALESSSGQLKDRSILESLNSDLSALIRLYLQYKVCEWTADGPSWIVERSLSIDLGGAVSRSIDIVAERIVALGGSPAASTRGQTLEVPQRIGSTNRDSSQDLASAHKAEREIVEHLDQHIRLARANGDRTTSGILSRVRAEHASHVDELASFACVDPTPNDNRREGRELRGRIQDELNPASRADSIEVGKYEVEHLVLDCQSCGRRRVIAPGPDGEFPSGFWRCPICNRA